MKTNMKTLIRPLVVTGLTLCAALWAMPGTAHAQIFVASSSTGTIGEYNLDGTTINASQVSGLNAPYGIAVSGGDIFVASSPTGTIGEYTTSGVTVNASLVSGLGGYPNGPTCIAVSGVDIFVANFNGTIGEYTTSGATVNATLVSGLGGYPNGIAVVAQPALGIVPTNSQVIVFWPIPPTAQTAFCRARPICYRQIGCRPRMPFRLIMARRWPFPSPIYVQ
jgi:hypothetical protein